MFNGIGQGEGIDPAIALQDIQNIKAKAWEEVKKDAPQKIAKVGVMAMLLFGAIYWFLIR